MMAVRTVFNLFCDCWTLYLKYISRKLKADDLANLTKDAEGIWRKYDKKPLAKDMVLAVLDEINRVVQKNN